MTQMVDYTNMTTTQKLDWLKRILDNEEAGRLIDAIVCDLFYEQQRQITALELKIAGVNTRVVQLEIREE